MARPTKQIKRAEKVTVRYTKVELRLIARYANRTGISMAEFVRAKSLDHQLRNKLTEEEADYYRKLIGMANNLNQLAHLGNSGKLLYNEIIKTLERVNQTIDKLL